jgi:hypothetical protein
MKHFLACLMVLLGAGLAQAQSMPVNCNGLNETDCALLQKNLLAMENLQSYAFDIGGSLVLEDLPDFNGTLPFSMTMSGEVVADFAALALSAEEAAAIAGDDAANTDYMRSLAEEVDMNMSMALKLPQVLVELYNNELPQNVQLNMVLTDGKLYFDLSSLRDALGRQGRTLPRGWYGIDLIEFIQLSQDPPTPSRSRPDMPDSGLLGNALNDPTYSYRFATLERLDDDVSATGEAVATFRTTYDYTDLWDDADIQDVLREALAMQGDRLSNREMDDLGELVSLLFTNLTVESTMTIGLETYYTYDTHIALTADLGPVLARLAVLDRQPSLLADTVVTLDLQSMFSQFNGVAPIETPPRATLIPLDMFGQMGVPLQQAKPIP